LLLIVKTSEEEQEEEEISERKNEDIKLSIDNRSSIGSIIIKRVKPCPYLSCQKINVKIDRDNWMVCSGCMKQYCFLCGYAFNGTRHFKKKCERYTPV
jgi:hypothetical protein